MILILTVGLLVVLPPKAPPRDPGFLEPCRARNSKVLTCAAEKNRSTLTGLGCAKYGTAMNCHNEKLQHEFRSKFMK